MQLKQGWISGAQSGQRRWGPPAAMTLAQFGLESAWGRAEPRDSNNPFGIKALVGQPFVLSRTREERKDGTSYWIDARFRKFASEVEAFEEHARLLGTSHYYALALAHWRVTRDLEAYVRAVGAVYATAHNYAELILQIIKGRNLSQYNVAGA